MSKRLKPWLWISPTQGIIADIKIDMHHIWVVKLQMKITQMTIKTRKTQKKRPALADLNFQKELNLLINQNMLVITRKMFLKTLVCSVLTYGCKAWTLEKQKINKLITTGMWFRRRITIIS